MIKKIFNTILNLIIIASLIYIVYYFYSSNKSNSLLENGILPEYFNGNLSSDDNISSLSNHNINISSNEYISNPSSKTSFTRYYYNQLDNNSKIIYSALENNIDNLKEENFKIDFSKTFNNLLNEDNGKKKLDKAFQSALDAFFYDHPELFYIDLTKITMLTKSTTLGFKSTYYVSLVPQDRNYLSDNFNSKTDVDNAINKVEDFKNRVASNVSGTDYDKALIVHDTLIDLLEYDKSTVRTNTHNIYGALVENTVVCEGYAKSFKYIMDELGIPCILVGGNATNSSGRTEPHMWNYIQLDGNWYGVDVTWDDPIIIGGYTKNNLSHNYFCKGYYSFESSHVPNGKISDTGMTFAYPKLSIENYK